MHKCNVWTIKWLTMDLDDVFKLSHLMLAKEENVVTEWNGGTQGPVHSLSTDMRHFSHPGKRRRHLSTEESKCRSTLWQPWLRVEGLKKIPNFPEDECNCLKGHSLNDALLGMEKAIFNHTGNERFRAIIHCNAEDCTMLLQREGRRHWFDPFVLKWKLRVSNSWRRPQWAGTNWMMFTPVTKCHTLFVMN